MLMRKTRRKILRFGLVGVANTFMDYAILNLLVFSLNILTPVGLVGCNVLSFLGANVNSYFMNKRWTFEDRGHWSQKEYLVFLLCSLGGLAISCSVIFFLTHIQVYPQWSFFLSLNVAKLLATVASMTWNFCSYRVFVFKFYPSEAHAIKNVRHGRSALSVRT